MSISYYNTQPNNSFVNQAGALQPNNKLPGLIQPSAIPMTKCSAIITMKYTDRDVDSCQTNEDQSIQSIQSSTGERSNLSSDSITSNQDESLTEDQHRPGTADTSCPQSLNVFHVNNGEGATHSSGQEHEKDPESHMSNVALDYEVEFCVLTQSVYPKTILSVSTPVTGTEPGTPPLSSTYTTSEVDLISSISSALSQLGVQPINLNALEVIGSPRCLPPQFQKALNSILGMHSNSENTIYRWKASSGYQEGFREVFLKNSTAPPTQVLTLERNLALKIKVIRGSYIENCTCVFHDLWAIQDLNQRQLPSSVQFIQLVISQPPLGICRVESAYTIGEVPSSNFHSVRGWVHKNDLVVRYVMREAFGMNLDDVLSIVPSFPVLYDKTGKTPLAKPYTGFWGKCCFQFLDNLNGELIVPQTVQVASSIIMCASENLTLSAFLSLQGCQIAVIVIFGVKAVRIIYLQSRRYGNQAIPSTLLAAISLCGLALFGPLIWYSADFNADLFHIMTIIVCSVGLLVFLFFYICSLNPAKDSGVYYGHYLMLGATLDARSSINKELEIGDLHLSKDLQDCLDHYRSCDINSIMAENNTPANQEYWREMAVLYRIRYATAPGAGMHPSNLSLKCPYSSMTRVQKFHYTLTRENSLRKLLEFPLESPAQIRAQFRKVQEIDDLFELF